MLSQESHVIGRAQSAQVTPFPSNPYVSSERRHRRDRRCFSVRAIAYGCRHPRRHHTRRLDCGTGGPVNEVPLLDIYSPARLLVVTLILLFSATDAILTIYLLQHGAEEINPVMKHLIELDVGLFALLKVALTGSACAVLLCISEFTLFRAAHIKVGHVLYPVWTGYFSLLVYEIILIAFYAR